jgi:hypothetical protein
MFSNDKTSTARIRERLREVEEAFDLQMRARGFDPTQMENLALPANLAKLYAEREELRRLIEEAEG